MKITQTNMNKYRILVLVDIFSIILFCACFQSVLCIVGRDLILTPRQGLQLNGKSIYYEGDSNEVLKNLTVHPWERTLKHVTFVTLFTDAAASAVAGNISKLKEYSDFLESPYIRKENANPIRFGDIVMLANGRLEQTGNNTFRFIEGTCSYDCQPERVWALWQVQKIRHRDQFKNFRYEMKFSISPLHKESQLNELREQAKNFQIPHGDMYVRQNALKTYIQKEDDYPQSFGRIIYPEETTFAQKRRHDDDGDDYMARNFRQVSGMNDYQQVTPIPQPTFMHSIYQPHPGLPPPPPPPPKRLNIGEFIKGFINPRATPKIELYPNIYTVINRNPFPLPTTFRPNYQIKLPRPDIYYPPSPPEMVRFPENRNEMNLADSKLNSPAPLVTHHFHHHFFMPGGGGGGGGSGESLGSNSGENFINSGEKSESELISTRYEHKLNRQVTPNYYYDYAATTPRQETNLLPAPQKYRFPIVNIGEHMAEVSPPPSFNNPQLYTSDYGGKIPVLVYAATSSVVKSTTTQKPFIQSEPYTETMRYSEPDPLYASDGQSGTQVESPQYNAEVTTHQRAVETEDTPPEAQLDSPEKEQYIDYDAESTTTKDDLDLNQSQKELQISTEHGSNATAVITTTTSTTTINPIISPPRHVTTPLPSTKETPTVRSLEQSSEIISTSTTETPLRALIRKRKGRPSTTVDPKISKWKPKRRNSNFKLRGQHKKNDDSEPKMSIRREGILSLDSEDIITTTIKPREKGEEVLEILTQKSVSKSVSVKVGSNGEEIPIMSHDEDDAANEVKT